MKWSVHENVYTPAAQVVDELPSGLYDAGLSWGRPYFRKIEPKTDRLFLLPRTDTERVMDEIKNFWTKKDLFDKYGVVYKRGILLYGAPGTGKTSLINMIGEEAGKLGAVCLRLKHDVDSFVAAMTFLREKQPERPIVVVIEDLDRHSHDEELLDMLDGASQIENVVFVATTNYPDQLPPRLVNRPSRFDLRIEIGTPGLETRQAFFDSVSEEKLPEWAEWAEKTEGLTFAHLKELFISVKILGNDFDTTLKLLQDMGDELSVGEEGDEDDEDYE